MSKLGNPALAVLATPEGRQATTKAINLTFTVIKVGLLGLAGYLIYRKVFPSFSKMVENPNFKPANVTKQGAESRAENLYRAMVGPGSNFDKVASNLRGLNYNGFARVYNSFGERRGADMRKQNLIEWLYDQFDSSELKELKFITNNAF